MSIVGQPFRIGTDGDVHSVEGVPLFTSELEQIIMTRCSGHGMVGELPWDCEFGSLVPDLLHDSNSEDDQKARVRRYIREAVKAYPSYLIKTITVSIENENGTKKVTATLVYDEEGVRKEYTLNLM